MNRLALLNTVGIHEPGLSIEIVAEKIEQIMAISAEAVPQVVPVQSPVS